MQWLEQNVASASVDNDTVLVPVETTIAVREVDDASGGVRSKRLHDTTEDAGDGAAFDERVQYPFLGQEEDSVARSQGERLHLASLVDDRLALTERV